MSTTPISPPGTAGYLDIQQSGFLTAVSTLLEDPTNVYWSLAELRLYLAEALRTWQALTGWYRGRSTLTTATGVNWYDLSASLSPALMGYTVTDQSLVTAMLYHLLENQLSGGAWAGTDQFSLSQVQTALQNRLNRFIGDSGVPLTYVLQTTGISLPGSTVLLPTGTMDLRRAAWKNTTSGNRTMLWKVSEWELGSFLRSWSASPSDPPQAYSQSLTNPNVLQLAPAPTVNGIVEMLVVLPGPTLSLSSSTTVLGVPDDLAWGIKWGTLADLLSQDGQAKDPTRAAYCESRYQEAVTLARTFPAVLSIQINGSPTFVGSVYEMDSFLNGWENLANATPVNTGIAGRNLIAVSPAPPASPAVTITMDLIQNMVIPANDAEYVQIPPDVLPALLGYVQHLASFKMGGAEFMATDLQRKNFYIEAANYNQRLRQLDFYNDAMRSSGLKSEAELPRLNTPALIGYAPPQGNSNG